MLLKDLSSSFERQSLTERRRWGERETERQRKREFFHLLFHSLATAGVGPDWSQEPRASLLSPRGCRGSRSQIILSYFLRNFSRELNQKQSSEDLNWHPYGCWYYRQHLNYATPLRPTIETLIELIEWVILKVHLCEKLCFLMAPNSYKLCILGMLKIIFMGSMYTLGISKEYYLCKNLFKKKTKAELHKLCQTHGKKNNK